MKVAIVGSRAIKEVDLSSFIGDEVTEIVSGGACGVDSVAKEYAQNNSIPYKELLPQYSKYGKAAPLVRNKQIVDYSDFVLIFWDGESRGTKHVIDYCKDVNKMHKVIICSQDR